MQLHHTLIIHYHNELFCFTINHSFLNLTFEEMDFLQIPLF